jgi:hypothetical protein
MSKRHLFIDDEIDFYDLRGLTKVLNPPEKHPDNPLLVPEYPWEEVNAQVYGTVLHDPADGRFRMWYMAARDPSRNHEVHIDGRRISGCAVGYAESGDGIQWEKPELGLVSFNGSMKNNLIPLGRYGVEGICVNDDENASDPSQRFKAVWWDHDAHSMKVDETGMVVDAGTGGLYAAWSADGIHWEVHPANPVVDCFSDTGQQLVWDSVRKKYVAFGRLGTGGRVIERSESPDFMTWSKPELVFKTDDMDRMGTQFYGMGVSLYEGLYVGMPWVLAQRLADTRSEGADGRVHVQLASSRDGIRWQRAGGRNPFIPNGAVGEWDNGIIYTATKPVVFEDRILIYYFGSSWPHEPGGSPDRPRGIGLATLRRDGFVSLDAGDQEGNFGTVPFEVTENLVIHLNLDARHGRVYARFSDAQRCEVIPDLPPSEAIRGDHLDATLRWTPEQLRPLVGQTLRARLFAQRTKFYSYWFDA